MKSLMDSAGVANTIAIALTGVGFLMVPTRDLHGQGAVGAVARAGAKTKYTAVQSPANTEPLGDATQVAPGVIRFAPAARVPDDRVTEKPRVAPLGPTRGSAGYQGSIVLPALTQQALDDLKREDTAQENVQAKGRLRIGIGRRFDQPVVVNESTSSAADWAILPDGWRIWSVQVVSPGAVGIRVHLESLSLPQGARIIAYDPGKPATSATPITPADLHGERQAWTETVFAERVVVECQLAPGLRTSALEFALTGLSHLYRPVLSGLTRQADYCELDVSCYPSWTSDAAGVAMMSFVDDLGASYQCTGCLLNSLPTSYVNYFLTANHCISDQTTASSLELYWFYQTSTCDGIPPLLSDVPTTSGGADFLAGLSLAQGNDFSFLRLRQAPPGGVTYEGWATGSPAINSDTLTAIHHPRGDYKRISFCTAVGSDSDLWDVQFNSGIIEHGSSGSPLFNANHEVIGQLWGGQETNCATYSGIDFYGRFDVTFNHIKQWLEPSTCNTLPAPTPTSPSCGASDASTTPLLSWTAAANANGYVVQFFSGSSCGVIPLQTSALLSADTTTWLVAADVGLQSGQTYSWQVQAKGDGTTFCDGPWSQCCSFSIPSVPPFTPIKGTYTGLFEDEVNGVLQDSSGLFTMNTTASGRFSGKLQMGGAQYSMSGFFDTGGQATITIVRRNQIPLTVVLQMDGTDQVIGTVTDGTWVAQLWADRAVFDGKLNIAPQQGTYTMYFAGDYGAASDPAGDGWGTVKVDGAGRLRFAASLADGTKITQAATVAGDGTWPLYVSLYGGQGSIQGWIAFNYSSSDDIGADALSWINPGTNAKYYPGGFATVTSSRGSRYAPPARGTTVLGLAGADVVLDGGDVAQSINDQILIGTNSRVTDLSGNKLSLIFSLSTGTFSGRMINPGTGKPLSFSGVILPKYDIGRGYFLDGGLSGEVQLLPPSQ